MTAPFKAGDRVRCILPSSPALVENTVYIVQEVKKTGDNNSGYYVYPRDDVMGGGWDSDRFELVEEEPLPADWAIQRAIDLGNETEYSPHYYGNPNASVTVQSVKDSRTRGSWFRVIAFARYIEANEEPPVDPVLLAAREFHASLYKHQSDIRKSCRDGEYDDFPAPKAFRAGVEWARENRDV